MPVTIRPECVERQVEERTKQGRVYLDQGDLRSAEVMFRNAYDDINSNKLPDTYIERACAFNLGAVLVASQQAKRGLEYLQKAIPPNNGRDGRSNGDLYYNFGLAYETIKNDAEAVKYYELSFEEYQFERDNVRMEAEVASRAGAVYGRLKSPLQAARSLGIAAKSYALLQEFDQQALNLCQQALHFLQSNRIEDSVQAADDCMVLCQRVHKQDVLGKLYNELGLIYTQCHDFSKAATCFELALPIIRSPPRDKRREAIILQNLGAVYNSLGDYQRALNFHENAASTYAELGNRASQGQCFINLAYAYSQLGNNDTVGECYLHAVQAAKDGGDKKGQWQAMEGLGAVYFNQGQVDKAVAYFKLALRMLAESADTNQMAQERIVSKLTDALQFNVNFQQYDVRVDPRSIGPFPVDPRITRPPSVQSVSQSSNPSYVQNVVQSASPTYPYRPDILVNDLPRPPTRDEQRQMQLIRSDLMRGRVPNALGYIAKGMGEYSTDDDLSVASSKNENRRPKSSRNRPTSARPPSGADHTDSRKRFSVASRDVIKPEVIKEEEASPPLISTGRRISKQGSFIKGLDANCQKTYQRRPKRGLLRTDTNNSEMEWNANVKDAVLSDASISDESYEYKERLRPPSTDEDTQSEQEGISTLNASEKHRNRDRVKQILKKEAAAGTRHYDDKDFEEMGAPLKVGTATSKIMTPNQVVKKETSSSAEGDDDDDETETGIETPVESRPDTSRAESRDDEMLMQYQHRIRRQSYRDEEGSDESESEEESNGDSETVISEDHHGRSPPSLPTRSPPQTLKLSNTYEDPLPSKAPLSEEESEDDDEEDSETEKESYHGGGEREDKKTEPSEEYITIVDFKGEQPEDLSFRSGEILFVLSARTDGWLEAQNSEGKRGMVPKNYLEVFNREKETPKAGSTMKRTVQDSEDPLYQTIRSFKGNEKQEPVTVRPEIHEPGPSGIQQGGGAPKLPPRNDPPRFDELSRAEQEEYLRTLHQQQTYDKQQHSSVYGGEEGIALPHKRETKKERGSKACIVM